MKETNKKEVTHILDDFNAKMGRADCDVAGEYGLGVRNDIGKRLAELGKDIDVPIINTYSKLPAGGLYSWKSTTYLYRN